ncbi:MAG: T9SS type A sorting domain-containing protein [Cyclobacteriaceae bacterium]
MYIKFTNILHFDLIPIIFGGLIRSILKILFNIFLPLVLICSAYSQVSLFDTPRGCLSIDSHTHESDSCNAILMDSFHTHQNARRSTITEENTSLYKINVIVHVLYNNSTQNISEAQIQSQIDVLNKDFTRTNADKSSTPSQFLSVAGNPNIIFELDTITRTFTSKSFWDIEGGDFDDMKFDILGGKDVINSDQYLNIWVCQLDGGFLGYAQFPAVLGSGATSPLTDGVVLDYRVVGTEGAAGDSPFFDFDLGRTATHEVGHWLGLRHIWGDGNCSVDDGIDDTPRCSNSYESSFGENCPTPGDQCPQQEGDRMIENYMDYSDDGCMNLFTTDQAELMRFMLETQRENVYTVPSLSISHNRLVEGDSVVFTLGASDVDSVLWEFDGGAPFSSKSNNPIIYYASADTFDVKLTSYNDGEEETVTLTNAIIVDDILQPYFLFSADTVFPLGNSFRLVNASLGTDSIRFDFGDGNFSFLDDVVYVYPDTGRYDVGITIYGHTGEVKSSLLSNPVPVHVYQPLGATNVFFDKEILSQGDSVLFVNNTEGSVAVDWVFEGGIPDTAYTDSVYVTYENMGVYGFSIKNYDVEDSLETQYEDILEVEFVIPEDTASGAEPIVFPNPLDVDTRFVKIFTDTDKSWSVKIFDSSGNLVLEFDGDPQRQLTIDTETIKSGMYYIEVDSEAGTVNRRMMKR